ncbi:hypothetical protein SAMN02745857_00519 [Andreprevotia lacus DSM 23236]|uniref:Uncharacterized protein n=1 Tax=Andreprevotia lacus DSM 23236 TaxID=1121001 RepID=A0A1W1X2V2_9NEIS|nr:hypothetical protein SAMN02745857_00519 [Andreprevotia lacus DSM 23236]
MTINVLETPVVHEAMVLRRVWYAAAGSNDFGNEGIVQSRTIDYAFMK